MNRSDIERWLQREDDELVYESESQLTECVMHVNPLTDALIRHYSLLVMRHNVVPEWMLVYAVCPEHWVRLLQESNYRFAYNRTEAADCIRVVGFEFHLNPNAAQYPPICLFHSLGV